MRLRFTIGFAAVLLAAGCRNPAVPEAARPAARPEADFARDIRPVLAEYCHGCHNGQKHKGDVVLDKFTDAKSLEGDRATWEKVLKNLRNRQMPPEEKPQPTEEQRALLAGWLDATLFRVDCAQPDPGRVTIRRLNRVEYNNTIRDLVGVDFKPAENFPADDVGYGFDNIGDVLSMPPILLEKYMAAAEQVVEAAIVIPNDGPRVQRFAAPALEGTTKEPAYTSEIRSLTQAGEVFVDYNFPASGEYTLRVRAFQQSAGDEPARMALRVAGKELKVIEVSAGERRASVLETRFQAPAGTNRLALAFLNPITVTNVVPPPKDKPRQRPETRVATRRLLMEYVEVVEPAGLTRTLPATHRRIFLCHPQGGDTNACVREIIGQFARRAFRRPVTADEVDRLVRLYDVARQQGDPHERGIQLALQAVLVSPHFLFRGEITPEPDNPKAVHPVNDFALASRLSYFLWSSLPDEELFQLAGRGELRRAGVLEAQVRRMLKDPKSEALVENFTGQWLQIRNLARVTPDTNTFPAYTEELRADMEQETERFFAAVMREDRSLLDFIDGPYTYVNERLARHYGLKGVKGEQFQKVSFRDRGRGGVLTHAAVLTITSNPTRTSPVKRGKWVLDNLLGTPPPPPPPDVPIEIDKKELTGTLRQKLEEHRKNPNCASCHERMDPIGFGLENFNAIGQWRDLDDGLPIDPSGELTTGEKFKGPAELRRIIRGQKDLFVRCLTEKMLTYALGRGLEYYDRCAVDRITAALAQHDYKFSVLATEIVKSTPFQMRRGDAAPRDLARP